MLCKIQRTRTKIRTGEIETQQGAVAMKNHHYMEYMVASERPSTTDWLQVYGINLVL